MEKPIALLLTISLAKAAMATTPMVPADKIRSLEPSQCTPEMPPCLCFLPPAVERIADGIKELTECNAELRLSRKHIQGFRRDNTPAIEWWQQPAFVIGGIAVGFSLGSMVGLFAARQ